jgi:hypothetical protein
MRHPQFSIAPVLPCGHPSGLSYVAADGLSAWCMVCETDVELGEPETAVS